MEKERVTYKVDGKKVTVHHFTETLSGGQWFDTTFDMTKISEEERLVLAARTATITWRGSAGVKKLTAAEIVAKGLGTVTVDLSEAVKRAKHVETEEEKQLKVILKQLLSGQGGTKMSMADILKRITELQAVPAAPAGDEDMEAGEDATKEDA